MDDFSEDEFLNDDLEMEISRIASDDDKAAFVSIMKGLYQSPIPEEEKVGKKEPDTTEAKYCPPEILDWICSYNAVDCATALLEGETGFIVDLNVPLIQGEYPLHVAADNASYDMTDLFLRHGARTDVRTIDGLFKGGMIPLNVMLQKLSYHRYLVDWTPKQSIFKLIVILCLPQMRMPLELIKLLAWNTKEVNEVFYHYAMEGKLIEMAALLMVAREKVMASSMFQGEDFSGLDGSMSIRQSILKEITLLTDEEIKLIGNSKRCKSVQMVKDKKAVMTLGLLLLELFERDCDAIDTYRQTVRSQMPKQKVAEGIKMLLGEVGFFFKDRDINLSNIDCESENIKLATEVLEKRTAFRSHNLCMPLHSSSGSFCEEKNPITNKMNERSGSISKFFSIGSHVLCPAKRPYHTLPSLQNGFASNPIKYPFKDTTIAMKHSAAYFLSSRKFASFALAIKKGITRI
uniref:Uncharacterized protein n=1 Tax=Davidia involucrata TaxID=16924 RepID=A0A5B6YSH7_DAVIN